MLEQVETGADAVGVIETAFDLDLCLLVVSGTLGEVRESLTFSYRFW